MQRRRRDVLALLGSGAAAGIACAGVGAVTDAPSPETPETQTPETQTPETQTPETQTPETAGVPGVPGAPQGPRQGTVVCQQPTAAAVADCLRAAGEGGDVFLPAGTYRFDDTLEVPWDGLTIRGAGDATVLQATDNRFNLIHLPRRRGVTLQHLRLSGAGQDGRGGAGLIAFEARQCRFEQLRFERFGASDAAGLHLVASPDNAIVACHFEDNGRGIHLYDRATGNLIAGCTGRGNAKEMIFLTTGCTDCVVRDCVSDGDGARRPAVSIAIHKSDRTVLRDCVVRRSGQEQGVEIAAGDDNVVAGCTIAESAWAGLHLINARRTLITGNTITGNQQSGILLRSGGGPDEARPCDDCVIVDNLIAGNNRQLAGSESRSWAGIEIEQGNRIRVEGNRILDNSAAAISIGAGNAGVRIAGNVIEGRHTRRLVDRGRETETDVAS